ncbi:MFS transporter [Halosegnis rubeus]|jgi:MFS family permease|uniref:MFS transporter n=1 Tax=Halosegnis rubeus TaxID=2212850 RepID=A0A5N5U7P9_9EURY|nr:MFS transporter [Halosegnis rubeus]KAB7514518.1 MFS transporter [Halosegnis rubeus]
MSVARNVRQSPAVLVIFASTLIAVMGVSLISPALPAVQDALNITESQASLLLSAFTLPGVVLTIPLGMLADRIGRKPILVPSLVLFGLCGSGIVFVESAIPISLGPVVLAEAFPVILALRAVQGAASSAIAMVTVTLIGDSFDGDTRRKLIGTNAAILAFGAAAYPLLGGALATIAWTVPFLCFGLGLVVAVPGLFVLSEPERKQVEDGEGLRAFLTGPTSLRPYAVLYAAILGIFVILYGAQLTAVPFLLDNTYRLSSLEIGLLLGIPAVAMGTTATQTDRILARVTSFQSIALGFVVYGVGMGIVATTQSVAVSGFGLLLFGFGQGFAEPITDTALNELAPDEFRGSIMSVRTSVLRLGTTIGPPVCTVAALRVGYRHTLLAGGVLAGVVGLCWLAASYR